MDAIAKADEGRPSPRDLLLQRYYLPEEREVHLLDYAGGDLYGRVLELSFMGRLREERRFSGPDDLRAQIVLDHGAMVDWVRRFTG